MVLLAPSTALTAARASYDTQLAAAKASFDTQKEIMSAENRRLDRENGELRGEVKELRAKKDKGLPEMAKEIEAAVTEVPQKPAPKATPAPKRATRSSTASAA